MEKYSNSSDIFISVIVPTYKPARYLYDCLDSLVNQRLSYNNFEVLVVLNGEKNPFFSEIRDYISKHPGINFRLFYSEQKGVSAARNFGLGKASGKGIVFVDDDDLLSQNYLGELLTHRDGDLMVITNMKTFRGDINQPGNDYISLAYEKCRLKRRYNVFDTRSFYSNVCGKLLSRESIGGTRFNQNIEVSEDSVFMVEISKNIPGIIFTSPDAIYYRRIRDNSASRKKRTVKEHFNTSALVISQYLACIHWSLGKNNILFIALKIIGSLRLLWQNVMKELQ